VRFERAAQGGRRAGQQLGVLVEEQAVAPPRALQQRGVVLALVAGWLRAAPAEPSREALSSTSTSVSKPTAARSAAIASRQRISSLRCSVFTTQ
jgi:hypothetical protein